MAKPPKTSQNQGADQAQPVQPDPDLSGLSDISLVPLQGPTGPIRLSEVLAQVGNGLIDVKDRPSPVSSMEYLAEMLWSFIITGRAKYTDGMEVRVPNNDQWLKIAKWVIDRMEGPPPKEIYMRKTQTVTKIDLSTYSIEDLERLKALAEQIQGVE